MSVIDNLKDSMFEASNLDLNLEGKSGKHQVFVLLDALDYFNFQIDGSG